MRAVLRSLAKRSGVRGSACLHRGWLARSAVSRGETGVGVAPGRVHQGACMSIPSWEATAALVSLEDAQRPAPSLASARGACEWLVVEAAVRLVNRPGARTLSADFRPRETSPWLPWPCWTQCHPVAFCCRAGEALPVPLGEDSFSGSAASFGGQLSGGRPRTPPRPSPSASPQMSSCSGTPFELH